MATSVFSTFTKGTRHGCFGCAKVDLMASLHDKTLVDLKLVKHVLNGRKKFVGVKHISWVNDKSNIGLSLNNAVFGNASNCAVLAVPQAIWGWPLKLWGGKLAVASFRFFLQKIGV